jgi:rhodanese-related sulfurtransferase/DNA-binding transcriptional ArsR family regulator
LEEVVGDRAAKTALFDQFARVGKALGSGKRLELLDLLAQGERTVESLAAAADLGLTTASAHLQTLKHANLVATRRAGTKIYYRLAGKDVAALFALVRAVAHQRLPDVAAAVATYLGPETDQVSREELLRRARDGEVVVLDVRPELEYAAGHIPGALSVPLDELPERLADLPADQEIVAYCRGAYCVLAHDAVRELTRQGRRARRLADGMLEWRLAGLPIARSASDDATAEEPVTHRSW